MVHTRQQLLVNSDVSMQSAYRITNALDAVNPQDYVTLAQLQAVQQGLDPKQSVRAATTANITLSGTQTIDGVALSIGDRVLVKNQTTGANNGIYLVASGAWTRTIDADSSADVTGGMFVFVNEGTVQSDTGWILTTNDAITLGTTALVFVQFSGAGSYIAGSGLTLTGTSFSVNTDATTIQVISGNLSVRSTATQYQVLVSSGTAGAAAVWSTVNLASTNAVSGILAIANGGTNSNAALSSNRIMVSVSGAIVEAAALTHGQLLIGSTGAAPVAATITAGANISVTNAAGSITIAATGVITSANHVFKEIPSGTKNGVNPTFTIANTPTAGTVCIYVNGVRAILTSEYTISGSTITFLGVAIPISTDDIEVDYMK